MLRLGLALKLGLELGLELDVRVMIRVKVRVIRLKLVLELVLELGLGLGAVRKRRLQLGGGDLSSLETFRASVVLQMQTSVLFCAKTIRLLKFMVYSTDKVREGVQPMWTRGRGKFFHDFLRSLLWAAP